MAVKTENSISLVHEVLVFCLCAQWCGVCRDYTAEFKRAQSTFGRARFIWIDVEDQADLVDTVDIDNFPTLLVTISGMPVFFGSITPRYDSVVRLLEARLAEPARHQLTQPEIVALSARLEKAI